MGGEKASKEPSRGNIACLPLVSVVRFPLRPRANEGLSRRQKKSNRHVKNEEEGENTHRFSVCSREGFSCVGAKDGHGCALSFPNSSEGEGSSAPLAERESV